jgi:hypothetical protein
MPYYDVGRCAECGAPVGAHHLSWCSYRGRTVCSPDVPNPAWTGIRSAWVRAWIVLALLAGAGVGIAYAAIQRPSVERRVVLRYLPGANGTLTDAQCRAVPRGASYAQVLQAYGWPRHVPNSQRGVYSYQQTGGMEMDYPIASSLHSSFVRFCAVVFATKGGQVDHQWEDLP